MSFETIKKSINDLKIESSETEIEALNILHDQFNRASNAQWSTQDLIYELKEDNDVLWFFDPETSFYEAVRNIQDSIINFFGE